MRVATSDLNVRRAYSLNEALQILHDELRTPIAGATDIAVALNFGTEKARRFLDLQPLDELRTLELRDDTVMVGALVTYSALIRSPLINERLPMLVQAARQVGGIQIQNRGTLAGNIAEASPAGDALPVLMAADAVVVLRSITGERRVPLTAYYTGYRSTVARPDELIVAVEIPPVFGQQWFRKVGTRAALAISKVVMAGVRTQSSTTMSPQPTTCVRLAFGSVAPTVVRATRTEAALSAGSTIDEAVQILASEITPIDDIRSTADYRRLVAGNLLRRFWSDTAP